jgi:hypothetical protein
MEGGFSCIPKLISETRVIRKSMDITLASMPVTISFVFP